MVNLILITHGGFARGIMDAAHLIVGEQDGVVEISLREDDSIDEMRSHLMDVVSKLYPESDGLLILVDLFGASPFNAAAMIDDKTYPNLEVISGLNLPMLLEVLIARGHLSLAELSALAEESGHTGIKVLSTIKANL